MNDADIKRVVTETIKEMFPSTSQFLHNVATPEKSEKVEFSKRLIKWGLIFLASLCAVSLASWFVLGELLPRLG